MLVEINQNQQKTGLRINFEHEYIDNCPQVWKYRFRDSNLFVADRMLTLKQLVRNLTNKHAHFVSKCQSMEGFIHKYFLLECDFDDFMEVRIDGAGKYILLERLEWLEKCYGVKMLFVDDKKGSERRINEIINDLALDTVLGIEHKPQKKKNLYEIMFTKINYPDYRTGKVSSDSL